MGERLPADALSRVRLGSKSQKKKEKMEQSSRLMDSETGRAGVFDFGFGFGAKKCVCQWRVFETWFY
jgi:hypothetical protein